MKSKKFTYLIVAIILISNISIFAQKFNNTDYSVFDEMEINYAVVVKQSTYDDSVWQIVTDSLLAKYQGQLFLWTDSLNEIKDSIAVFQPTHIGFVCEFSTASSVFIKDFVWNFVRELDDDDYCDAIWGIITGYEAEDALNLVTGSDGFDVKTVLGGTTSCDLVYYTQGISTSETTYGSYFIKYPDSSGTTAFTDGPEDRVRWLVTMINQGIDIFDYDPVDIFYTSGHGNYNEWQLHYPTSGLEGFFRSKNGQAYGDSYRYGLRDSNIISNNPKIYFGIGNCLIGKIVDGSSMAPSWIHTGGAYQYTGYVINEGSSSHQHGGTKAYFYKVARNFTWAESYFLANQALKFDIINNTPGTNPPDLNGSALYGDPGMQVKMSNEGVFREPLFTSELTINEGGAKDTVTFKITMNREGTPGFSSKWGERHPAIILPFYAGNIEILNTDAIEVVVEDNFALMYIWYQGEPSLAEGETREVVFLYNNFDTGIDKPVLQKSEKTDILLYQNNPNPFNENTEIRGFLPQKYNNSVIKIYSENGLCLKTYKINNTGEFNIIINGNEFSPGLYIYSLIVNNQVIDSKRMIINN
ncbi:MAG: T9SS type A sorting domain-containing protein [Bacteroidales bacterium]|nr:T9SS type A sorting domain-containing protein [Bacteroidales bacterium]